MKKIIKSIIRRLGYNLEKLNLYTDQSYHQSLALAYLGITRTIDVGANRGQFASDLFASGYKGSIVSIEPLTEAWTMLEKVARLNERWSVMPRCALGEVRGTKMINLSKNLDSSSILPMGRKHLEAAPWSKYIGNESCSVYALDDIFDSLKLDDESVLLKIDCQGYEKNILDGASNSLAKINAVLTEVSLVELYTGQSLWLDIYKYMMDRGFSVFSVFKGFSNPKSGETLQLDILFAKKPSNS